MKKKIAIIISIIILVPVIAAAAGYGYLYYHYQNIFMPGLSINNVYAADMTVSQVNERLKENLQIPEVTVTDKDGETFTFSMSEAGYDENYTDDLKKIKAQQTVMGLVYMVTDKDSVTDTRELFAEKSYDENKLIEYLDGLDFIKDNTQLYDKKVELCRNTRGYYLVDETKDLLNHEKAVTAITEAVASGEYEVDLKKSGCYESPERYNAQQKNAISTWKKIKPYMNSEITFQFTDRYYVVDSAKIAEWLVKGENGRILMDEETGLPALDEEAITEFVKEMCDNYSTVNKPRTFKSHRGDMVTIEKGTYGSRIDYKPEVEYLLKQIPRGTKTTRIPEYTQVAYSGLTGLDDIGDTYIEVDMSEQHLYYYRNGRLTLDSDVVTGNTSLGRGTPERVCYVYFKQRNRTLHGEDYDTFVNYWMAVYNNIGIHDANWRGRFGGSIYKTAGSHGCVNTPISKVKELYDMVEVGTPVLLYY